MKMAIAGALLFLVGCGTGLYATHHATVTTFPCQKCCDEVVK